MSLGQSNAAGAGASMRSSYQSLGLVLSTGICGGAPYSGDVEILLGDMVISNTVVHYDFSE